MEVALVCLLALMVAYIWQRDKTVESERREWTAERAQLLQRIQAPDVAVATHAVGETREPVNGMPLFSDEDYAEMTNAN